MSDQEDNYIKQSESDQVARIRRERQLEALRREELGGIAAVLQSDVDVAQEAIELGFDRETARILHLLPVIQMAWADGSVQDVEREKLLELASNAGIAKGSPAYDYLELLMEREPSPLYFQRTNNLIARMLEQDSAALGGDDLMKHVEAVASAAGGFFGLGKISREERELIAKLHALFDR